MHKAGRASVQRRGVGGRTWSTNEISMIPAASLIGSNVCVMPKPETSRCTFKQRRGEGWKRNFLPQPMSQGMTSPSVLPSTPPGSRFVDVHRHGVPLLPPHLPRAAQLSVRHCLSTSSERFLTPCASMLPKKRVGGGWTTQLHLPQPPLSALIRVHRGCIALVYRRRRPVVPA